MFACRFDVNPTDGDCDCDAWKQNDKANLIEAREAVIKKRRDRKRNVEDQRKSEKERKRDKRGEGSSKREGVRRKKAVERARAELFMP